MEDAVWAVLWNKKPIAWFVSYSDAGDFIRAVSKVPGLYERVPV